MLYSKTSSHLSIQEGEWYARYCSMCFLRVLPSLCRTWPPRTSPTREGSPTLRSTQSLKVNLVTLVSDWQEEWRNGGEVELGFTDKARTLFGLSFLQHHVLLTGGSWKDTKRGMKGWEKRARGTGGHTGHIAHYRVLIKTLCMWLGLHTIAFKDTVQQLCVSLLSQKRFTWRPRQPAGSPTVAVQTQVDRIPSNQCQQTDKSSVKQFV